MGLGFRTVEALNTFVSANLGAVIIGVAAVAVVGLAVGVTVLRRIGSISGRFSWVTGESAETAETLPQLLEAVARNRRDIDGLVAGLAAANGDAETHLKHVGLVRYDAFQDISGQQSFSLCLLDSRRDGVLVSNLVSTNSTRSYAVELKGGEASRTLSDEEAAALTKAMEKR